jgi:hypothetical protein
MRGLVTKMLLRLEPSKRSDNNALHRKVALRRNSAEATPIEEFA